MPRERYHEPWHADFVHAVETFRIPRPLLRQVRDVLEAFAVILDAWEDHHVGEQYWAGTGTYRIGDRPDRRSLFGEFYDVLRNPQASRQEILRSAENIVRYFKSLIFAQAFCLIMTGHGLRGRILNDVTDPYNPRNPNRVPSLLNWNSHDWAASLGEADDGILPMAPLAPWPTLSQQPPSRTNAGMHVSWLVVNDLLTPWLPAPVGPSARPLRPLCPLQNADWPSEPLDPAGRRAPPPPWDAAALPNVAVRRHLRPNSPYNLAPLELARTTAWHRLTTVVRTLQPVGLPASGMADMFLQLDYFNDMCLGRSGLAARIQWYLAMVLVGEDRSEAVTLRRVHRLQCFVHQAIEFGVTNVRVEVAGNGFRPIEQNADPNAPLADLAHSGGARTLSALGSYTGQLLCTVNSMRIMHLWQDRPGALASRFRLRLGALERGL